MSYKPVHPSRTKRTKQGLKRQPPVGVANCPVRNECTSRPLPESPTLLKIKTTMKKLLVISFVLASSHSFGQSFIQGITNRLSFGVKAGANCSNYVNADFATDPLIGFHAGAIVNFRLTRQLSVQEEFLFSSQGAKIADIDRKVYYLTVPILLKYRTNPGVYLEAGVQAGMRMHEDVKDFSKQVDVGAAAGIGYQSRMGLGVGIRYIAGVSKAGNVGDFRSGVAQASVFYIF